MATFRPDPRTLTASLLLLAAAFLLGPRLVRNADAVPGGDITIYVRSNGVHTDIVMPKRAASLDWGRLLPADHVRWPERAGDWVAIGTGERRTFLETPRWRDIRLPTVAGAIFGGELLLHVEHLREPGAGSRTRALRLGADQYRRLATAVALDFARNGRGRARPLPGTGYGPRDTFYLARGRYDALRNCNQWTADRLAGAGVRVGGWTPLAPSLLGSLR